MWSEVRTTDPELTRQLRAADPDFVAPGGESYLSYATRIERLIREENLRHPSETIAVVTHDGVVRSLITNLLGWPASKMSASTVFVGSVSSITVNDDMPRLDLLNYHDHLTPSYADVSEEDQSK